LRFYDPIYRNVTKGLGFREVLEFASETTVITPGVRTLPLSSWCCKVCSNNPLYLVGKSITNHLCLGTWETEPADVPMCFLVNQIIQCQQ
jgi:hypothetical protein